MSGVLKFIVKGQRYNNRNSALIFGGLSCILDSVDYKLPTTSRGQK